MEIKDLITEQIIENPTNLPETISDAAAKLRNGLLTCQGLVESYLAYIKKLEPHLHAFITVTENQALEAAATLDSELTRGEDRGPLHGIPIVYKDIIDTAGVSTTLGSPLYRTRVPQEDATVVSRLKAAGTVMLGKTNLPEFASDASGQNLFYGDVRNPWNLAASPGGSSSGTGVAVAAGMCLGGLGSDTGGSIRIPASWMGIVGIRPTFGLVSLYGVHPRARSLDCVGPMARTVEDCAHLLNAAAGYDPRYCHSARARPNNYTIGLRSGVKRLRLAIIRNYTFHDVDEQIANAIYTAINKLAILGAEIREINIPLFEGPLEYSCIFDILLYEFYRVIEGTYRATENKEKMFGPVVRANIIRGKTISKETYEKALAERPKQIASVKRTFNEIDALLVPTAPMTAPPVAANRNVYDRARQFNIPSSFLGFPSVSVPCGFDRDGLPIGLQMIGDELQEALLMRIAYAYEEATQFWKQQPYTTRRLNLPS